jgi:hypothetical protein
MQSSTRAAATIESLEPRRLLSAIHIADQLAFAFPLGAADPVGIATDAQGNIYVGGHFEGTVDFNPARRKHFNLTAVNVAGDPFVAKYSHDGRLFWAEQISFASTVSGRRDLTAGSLAADAAGNVYLGGGFLGTTDFDPGAGVFNLTPGTNAGGDAYLLALDTNGNFRYANRLPTPGTRGPDDVLNGAATNLATDAAGYVYLANRVQDEPDLAPQHTNVTLTKFTARGRTLWVRSFAGAGATVTPLAMTVDSAGDAFLTGHVFGSVDFDPGTAVRTVPSNSDYILRLTPDGDLAWLGGLSAAPAYGLTTDAAGNLYAAGNYAGAVDFNFSARKSFTLTAASGSQDAYLAKYSSDGALAWAHSMGSGNSDGAFSVAVAADGTVYAAGEFSGRAYFNPGVSRFKLTSQSTFATFFAAFTPAGVFLTASQISPRANQLIALPAGGLLVTGFLQTAGDADPGPGVLTLTPLVPSLVNMFLLELL